MCIKELIVGLKYESIGHAYKYRKCSKINGKSYSHVAIKKIKLELQQSIDFTRSIKKTALRTIM